MDHLLMLLLLLWSSGLQTEGKHQSPGSQCDSKADIVMLVDGSSSIGLKNFNTLRSFLREIVNNFDIGPDKVQIGLVQFSHNPRTEWELNTHQTEQSLVEAINNLPYSGGNTFIGKALQYVLHNNFKPDVGMRADSQKIVVLITDGESQDDVSLVSQHLRDSGIEIYAIGVKGAEKSQLLEITADPAHVYMVDDFDALHHFVNNVTINICANSSLACKDLSGDLLFLIDSSGSIEPEDYIKMKDFMKSVISKSVIGQDEVRVGVMQYSAVQQVEFTLNQYYSKHNMSNAIDAMRQIGGGTHTGEAVTALSQYFDIARGGRPHLRQRLVVITDGKSQDEVKNPAAALRAKGVVIYAIGVVDASTIELLEISGSRDRVYSEKDFDALKDLVSKVAFELCDPGRDCKKTEKADIIFLVDGSTSITLEKFRSILKFMESMVNQTTVGKDLTRFGVIIFSNNPQSVFTLKDYTSKQQVLKAIKALRSPNGNTYTGRALEYSRQFFSAENGGRAALQVPQILMVITDGDATDRHSLTKPSVALRDEGVTVFSIGVQGADKAQLEIIAGQDKSRVFYVDNFNTLETLYKDITEALCNIKPDSVRLVNGTSLCSGRLEVKSEQSWSSVCEADFDQQDAEVVCRELGCGAPSALQGALYGKVETPMWTKKFQCGGNESALLDCRRSNSTRRTCSPGKAVGLICSETVRLVGGASRCEGTLEVKRTEWRPVSAFLWTQGNFRSRYSNWTLKEAAVACSDLDCGSAVSSRSRNEDSYRSVWWISSKCVQSGYALRGCVLSDSSSSILELTCSDLLLQPIISVSPTMDGVSGAQQQGFQVFWGSSFTISCSVQPQYPGGSFQLTFSSSNTAYNYTQPAVSHSADFLFPAADPAHQGNYSCVYGVYVFSHNFSSESRLLSLTVTDPDKTLYRTVFIIRLVVLLVALLLGVIIIYFILKASRGQKSDPQESIELSHYNPSVSRAEGEPAEEEGAQGAE